MLGLDLFGWFGKLPDINCWLLLIVGLIKGTCLAGSANYKGQGCNGLYLANL